MYANVSCVLQDSWIRSHLNLMMKPRTTKTVWMCGCSTDAFLTKWHVCCCADLGRK